MANEVREFVKGVGEGFRKAARDPVGSSQSVKMLRNIASPETGRGLVRDAGGAAPVGRLLQSTAKTYARKYGKRKPSARQ